jgi:hypothetical protein
MKGMEDNYLRWILNGKGVDIMKYYYGKVEFCINLDSDINCYYHQSMGS